MLSPNPLILITSYAVILRFKAMISCEKSAVVQTAVWVCNTSKSLVQSHWGFNGKLTNKSAQRMCQVLSQEYSVRKIQQKTEICKTIQTLEATSCGYWNQWLQIPRKTMMNGREQGSGWETPLSPASSSFMKVSYFLWMTIKVAFRLSEHEDILG